MLDRGVDKNLLLGYNCVVYNCENYLSARDNMITLSSIDAINEKQERMRSYLSARIYGEIPPRPIHLSCAVECSDTEFAAGKATMRGQILILDLGERKITLPFTSVIPNCGSGCPAIINFTTERGIPNKYLPAEELVDRGYAIFSLCMDDVSGNDGNFKSGLCSHIARSRKRKSSAGKLAVWAWAIMRVVDYVCDLECIDKSAVIVAGHGICARAAMLAAGFDERIGYVIANGASSYPVPYSCERPQSGITVRDFPHLYCPAFAEDPFGDEYFCLLSLLAPRCILIGSAEDGEHFEPEEEYGYLISLSKEYYLPCGLTGLDRHKDIPTAPLHTGGGEISYHIRSGADYFSREDWNIYLDFIDAKFGKNQDFDNSDLHFN